MGKAFNSHSETWRCYGNKAVGGDLSALGNLLEVYRPLLTAIASRGLSGNLKAKMGVSDLVQQTCEDAVIGISEVHAKDGNQLWRWLASLLSSNVCNVHRRFVRCQKRTVEREEPLSSCVETTAAENSVVDPVVQGEIVEQLHAAMNRLPVAHREVLRWRFLEEKSCEEIGAMVCRSPDAVRMMVNRALRKLERELPDGSLSS